VADERTRHEQPPEPRHNGHRRATGNGGPVPGAGQAPRHGYPGPDRYPGPNRAAPGERSVLWPPGEPVRSDGAAGPGQPGGPRAAGPGRGPREFGLAAAFGGSDRPGEPGRSGAGTRESAPPGRPPGAGAPPGQRRPGAPGVPVEPAGPGRGAFEPRRAPQQPAPRRGAPAFDEPPAVPARPEPAAPPRAAAPPPVRRRRGRAWLLLIPIVAPLLSPLTNSAGPQLAGIPFFYWYQMFCALLAIAVTTTVFLSSREPRRHG
jgi:Protein of unknown function (DUF3311)